ncbi:MAG: hypothetical protein LBC53_03670 [Spirochaetaceae bacterium]|nr:hypothetical protein [Spirochaetaceae bacterium]
MNFLLVCVLCAAINIQPRLEEIINQINDYLSKKITRCFFKFKNAL